MKIFIAIATHIGLFAGTQLSGCGPCCKAQASSFTTAAYTVVKENPKTVTVKITGMTCAGCANHVHTALSKTKGVITDEVKFPGDISIIKYDASKTSVAEIIKAIETTGYKAEVQKDKKRS